MHWPEFLQLQYGIGGTDPDDYATFATGILVFEAAGSVNVSHNALSGDQNEIYNAWGAASIWDNTLTSAEYYGILLYGADSPTSAPSTVGGNSIEGANVGVLVYDNNGTVTGNTFTQANVSIEAETDFSSTYTIADHREYRALQREWRPPRRCELVPSRGYGGAQWGLHGDR